MKHKTLAMVVVAVLALGMLGGCDPAHPADSIEATYSPHPLSPGQSATIDIEYPSSKDVSVSKWSDQSVAIVSGEDIVEVSGLTVTGVSPGTAVLHVQAVANYAFLGLVIDKEVISTDIEVEVA